jgi:hypothetical protein
MSEAMRWTRRNALGAVLAGRPRSRAAAANAATTLRWASVLPANHPPS